MKWELDLWYELWDRAGSHGLDTWYDPGGAPEDRRAAPSATDEAAEGETNGS